MAEFRNDKIYLSHMARQSKKRRGLKLSGDMYIPPSAINAPWIDNGGRNFSINGSQGSPVSVVYSSILLAQSTYEIIVTISSYIAGNLTVSNSDDSSDNLSADGEYIFNLSTITDEDINLLADAAFSGVVVFDSIRRVT